MFESYMELLQRRGQAWFYGITLGGGTLLLILSGWLWWHFTYLNPQTVFWGAFSNNLNLNGVTKHSMVTDNAGQIDQYEQLSLGAPNLVRSHVTVTQPEGSPQKSKVVTESIGTPQANFSRYLSIETDQKNAAGQTLNFGSVVNLWSKQDIAAGSNGSFADAIFDAIPFAHLTAAQRSQVIADTKRNQVYNTDFDKVGKERRDGRLYYVYTVIVAPDRYVTLLKQVDSMMGLDQLKNLDPAQYQGGTPVQLKISIDAHAHQLAAVDYLGTPRKEVYSAWGLRPSNDLPGTTISQSDLQTKLNTILNGQ